MDITLFSEMVKELILDNDEVTIPGLGTFVSEVVPSSFSDKGYTINPPYRKLSFRQRNGDDSMLVDFHSKVNGTDENLSRKILTEFISELKSLLQAKKVVVFPGLGRLRATRENTFFFISDEELDIYPYGFGLEAVSLKTHEETPEEVSAAVSDLRAIVDSPTGEDLPNPAPQEPAPQEPARQEPARHHHVHYEYAHQHRSARKAKTGKSLRRLLIILALLAAIVVVLFALFIILSHTDPDFIDSLLYSPEELRIINY